MASWRGAGTLPAKLGEDARLGVDAGMGQLAWGEWRMFGILLSKSE